MTDNGSVDNRPGDVRRPAARWLRAAAGTLLLAGHLRAAPAMAARVLESEELQEGGGSGGGGGGGGAGSGAARSVERERFTMGTTAYVRIEGPASEAGSPEQSAELAASIAERALDRIDEVDRAASLYRTDSDVVRVNAGAAAGPVRAGTLLCDLLGTSLHIAMLTGGAFDPTVKPLMDYLGFYREIGSRADPGGLPAALERVGWRRVRVDPGRGTVRFRRQGMALDFGGIGKGYALDRAASFLRGSQVRSAMIDLGRSSWYFIGRDPESADGLFSLGVAVPGEDGTEKMRVVVRVPEGSIATSSPRSQTSRETGRSVGHIVDPRRGPLETSVLLALVWAPSGTIADALTKPLVIGGPQALGRLRRRFRFEALLVLSGIEGSDRTGKKRSGPTPRILATPGLVWSEAADRETDSRIDEARAPTTASRARR